MIWSSSPFWLIINVIISITSIIITMTIIISMNITVITIVRGSSCQSCAVPSRLINCSQTGLTIYAFWKIVIHIPCHLWSFAGPLKCNTLHKHLDGFFSTYQSYKCINSECVVSFRDERKYKKQHYLLYINGYEILLEDLVAKMGWNRVAVAISGT